MPGYSARNKKLAVSPLWCITTLVCQSAGAVARGLETDRQKEIAVPQMCFFDALTRRQSMRGNRIWLRTLDNQAFTDLGDLTLSGKLRTNITSRYGRCCFLIACVGFFFT